ncbi:hypothetical protein [Hymenobacter qilianensis]|nr:hypothetical protein [Hymenobacter qilianensis]
MKRILLLLLLFLITAGHLAAQTAPTTLSGTVRDPGGRGCPASTYS